MGCAQSSPAVDAYEEVAFEDSRLPCVENDRHLEERHTSLNQGSIAELTFIGKLGQGAYATVHRARSAKLEDRIVAVKVVDLKAKRSKDTKELDAKKRRTCELEAHYLALAGGRANVIDFYGSFADGSLCFFLTELCDCSLQQAIDRLPAITEASMCRLLQEMLTGLSSVHEAGVVHRDVKPDNFLCVGPEATVKLCDFGLAEELPPGGHGLKGVFGTPPFMSPEMLLDWPHNHKTDAWSFGVIVYSLFFGRFPYEPPRLTGQAMKNAIRLGTPRPSFRVPASLDSAEPVSRGARQLAMALLHRDPARRLSVDEARKHSFFTSPGRTSLAPMLAAARVTGAFYWPAHNNPTAKNEVDRCIEASQRERDIAQKVSSKKESPEDACSLPSTGDLSSRVSSLPSLDGSPRLASASGPGLALTTPGSVP